MSKIAVYISNMFEDSEYVEPARAFREAGHQLVHIGKTVDTVQGKHGTEVLIERTAGGLNIEEFDAIFIPGGFSPDQLRVDDQIVEAVRRFAETGKPIFAICHGPQLLITADVLRGRTLTGWKSIWKDIENAGAHCEDREVVQDNNLITSRQPSDIPAFTQACLRKLEELYAHH